MKVAPFGGVKQSGLGREGSKYGMDEYLEASYQTLTVIDFILKSRKLITALLLRGCSLNMSAWGTLKVNKTMWHGSLEILWYEE